MNSLIDPSICNWQPVTFLFFSENIWGNFIYYSHFFPPLAGLIIASFVFYSDTKSKPSQALLFTVVMFTIWSLLDLILWASDNSDIIIFVWSSLIYFELLIYLGAFYFLYSFFNSRFPNIYYEIGFFILFIPLFLFGHTHLNLLGFDFTNCNREALEGPLWQNYIYYIELGILLLMIVIIIQELRKNQRRKLEILTVSIGIILFLLSFSIGNLLGSLETDWEIGQIGLFGMPIFVALLAYALVRFETFKVKILATEALMVGLFLLILSLLFVRTIENTRLITVVTLFLFSIMGALLVKSVRKEVKQRQQIEQLAVNLERANERLQFLDKQKSEFVSIASHQLSSPLTAIKGYTAMFLEGTYGELGPKMNEPLKRIFESAKLMAMSIDDFLNVSRIESGNMKYEYSEFSIAEQASHVVDDLRPEALKLGLILTYKSDLTSAAIVKADIGKTQQILHNLINNSLKYTPKGSVTVFVHENLKLKKIYIEIIDTGIGMSKETIGDLFAKFTRAKNANSVNIKGTGLGLFVAREMARAMKGDVTAHSDGDGKGSHFILTLPLVR
jgi:signal transduction histidine kinase